MDNDRSNDWGARVGQHRDAGAVGNEDSRSLTGEGEQHSLPICAMVGAAQKTELHVAVADHYECGCARKRDPACCFGGIPSSVLNTLRRGILGLVFSMACLCPTAQGAGQVFEAEGTLVFHNFLSSSAKTRPPIRFSAIVSNGCWFARITPTVTTAFEYQEAAYDGRNLYHLIRLNLAHGRAASTGNVATAWIYNNQKVIYDIFGHEIGAVWLMLASADSFRGSVNGLVDPAVTLGLFEIEHYHERPFKQQAKWSLQREFPGLPLEVVYLDDGEIKTSPQFTAYKRKPPFDLGFTNVVYRVTSLTNCGGFEVPWSAELDTFRPNPNGQPQLVHFTRYVIALTRWSNQSRPVEFKPRLPGLTVIRDARVFEAVGNHSHLAADEWPALDKITNAAGFADKAKITQVARAAWSVGKAPPDRRSRLARLCLLSVLLAPPLIWAINYWKRKAT